MAGNDPQAFFQRHGAQHCQDYALASVDGVYLTSGLPRFADVLETVRPGE